VTGGDCWPRTIQKAEKPEKQKKPGQDAKAPSAKVQDAGCDAGSGAGRVRKWGIPSDGLWVWGGGVCWLSVLCCSPHTGKKKTKEKSLGQLSSIGFPQPNDKHFDTQLFFSLHFLFILCHFLVIPTLFFLPRALYVT